MFSGFCHQVHVGSTRTGGASGRAAAEQEFRAIFDMIPVLSGPLGIVRVHPLDGFVQRLERADELVLFSLAALSFGRWRLQLFVLGSILVFWRQVEAHITTGRCVVVT